MEKQIAFSGILSNKPDENPGMCTHNLYPLWLPKPNAISFNEFSLPLVSIEHTVTFFWVAIIIRCISTDSKLGVWLVIFGKIVQFQSTCWFDLLISKFLQYHNFQISTIGIEQGLGTVMGLHLLVKDMIRLVELLARKLSKAKPILYFMHIRSWVGI
jgi:hypothetical protein